jgi:hypothetical protein
MRVIMAHRIKQRGAFVKMQVRRRIAARETIGCGFGTGW